MGWNIYHCNIVKCGDGTEPRESDSLISLHFVTLWILFAYLCLHLSHVTIGLLLSCHAAVVLHVSVDTPKLFHLDKGNLQFKGGF